MKNTTDVFTEKQLSALRNEYIKINTVGPKHLDHFHKMFDTLNDISLLQLCNAQIKFVSKLAVNAALRRGINPL